MKIPDYQVSVDPVTPNLPSRQTSVRPVPGAMTTVSEATERLGKVGTQIGEKLLTYALEKQRLNDEASLASLDTNFRLNLQDRLLSTEKEKIKINGADVERPKGLLLRELADADGAAIDLDKYYQDMRARYIAQARTPEMKQKLAASLDGVYLNARDNVIRHEAKQGRLNLSNTFKSNLEQQYQDSVTISDPVTLSRAVAEVQKTQSQINTLDDVDATTAGLNLRKAAAELVTRNAIATLRTTADLQSAMNLVESQREVIGEENYLSLSKKLSDGSQVIARQAKTIENTQKIQDRYNFLVQVANGTINWDNADDAIKTVALKDPELAQVVQNVVQAGGKYVPTGQDVIGSMAFRSVAQKVINSATPDEASEFLVKALKGKNGGNISLDHLGLLVDVAKEHAAAMRPDASQKDKDNWAWFKAAYNAVSQLQYLPHAVTDFMNGKRKDNVQGQALQKRAKEVIRASTVTKYPQLGTMQILPNKVLTEDGDFETIYEGNLGDYADFTDQRE